MSTLEREKTTSLEILDSLDFAPELPCEHPDHNGSPQHEGPAALLVEELRRPCGHGRHLKVALCRKVWNVAGQGGVRCKTCNDVQPRSESWRVVAVLR